MTSALRKEQEEDVRIHERLREYKKGLQEAEGRLADTNRRLSEVRGGGAQSQTAEQLLAKLQKDVRELADRREILETSIADREIHLEKLHSWNSSDRMTTEDDVRSKRDQVRDMEDQVASLHESLEAALERNTKLVVFKQASTIALKKMREKEDEVDKITDEKRRIAKQSEDKEGELRAQGKLSGNGGKMGKQDLKKYGAVVKEKIERYKKMREELSTLRGELVVLQRTEQILRSRDRNVEDFLTELERKKGIEVSIYYISIICNFAHFHLSVRVFFVFFFYIHIFFTVFFCNHFKSSFSSNFSLYFYSFLYFSHSYSHSLNVSFLRSLLLILGL